MIMRLSVCALRRTRWPGFTLVVQSGKIYFPSRSMAAQASFILRDLAEAMELSASHFTRCFPRWDYLKPQLGTILAVISRGSLKCMIFCKISAYCERPCQD